MSNITIVTPEEGVYSPFNNCIASSRTDNFSSIVKLSDEDVDVFDFYGPVDVESGLLKVTLKFSPETYIQDNEFIKLLNLCNATTGTSIEMPKTDDEGNYYLDYDNTDYSGLIMVPESVEIKFTVTEGKAIAIIGNNIVQKEQTFEFPANTYIPVRFIMGTGDVKTNYSGENIFYSFMI